VTPEPTASVTLEGLLLPVTTPFDETGEVDRSGFVSNLRHWLSEGADGIVAAGSTGEAPLLDEIETLRLVEDAREALPPGGPLVVGTGQESTRGTIRLCQEVARAGADAVLVRPPSYYADALDAEAVAAHYRWVADGSPVPVVLYHIPRYVSVGLDPDLVARLVRHENVVGIKDSSGDVRNLGALVEACEGRATVLVGSGTLLYGGLELGARGGILAVGLLATRACARLIEAFREADAATAGAIQERIGALHRSVVGKRGVPGVKAGLEALGLRGGPPRSPLRPADGTVRREVESALRAAGLLSESA